MFMHSVEDLLNVLVIMKLSLINKLEEKMQVSFSY